VDSDGDGFVNPLELMKVINSLLPMDCEAVRAREVGLMAQWLNSRECATGQQEEEEDQQQPQVPQQEPLGVASIERENTIPGISSSIRVASVLKVVTGECGGGGDEAALHTTEGNYHRIRLDGDDCGGVTSFSQSGRAGEAGAVTTTPLSTPLKDAAGYASGFVRRRQASSGVKRFPAPPHSHSQAQARFGEEGSISARESALFDEFCVKWANKHGAPALKEAQMDREIRSMGASWTAQQTREWKIVHPTLTTPPPPTHLFTTTL